MEFEICDSFSVDDLKKGLQLSKLLTFQI